MYSGQLAITKELINRCHLTEYELLQHELKRFGSQFLIYAKKELEKIVYYKWVYYNDSRPNKKYLIALMEDGWKMENEVVVTN